MSKELTPQVAVMETFNKSLLSDNFSVASPLQNCRKVQRYAMAIV
jgi:hypothetical protein